MVMDRIAPVISDIVDNVAALGFIPVLCIFSWMASTTTMASSTTIPIANTRANIVRTLSENPKSCRKKKVPTNETGIAIAGIKVDLKSCRKIKTIINTRIKASKRVCSTWLIDSSIWSRTE
ncbi:hypothetical protein D3C81_872450 [compost metagenome]